MSARDFCNISHRRFVAPLPGSRPGGPNTATVITAKRDSWKLAKNAPPGTRLCIVNFTVLDDFPPIHGSIRGRLFLSGHVLTAMAGDKTFIQSIQHANPGGSIPVWFLNKILAVGPPKVVRGIESCARKWLRKQGYHL